VRENCCLSKKDREKRKKKGRETRLAEEYAGTVSRGDENGDTSVPAEKTGCRSREAKGRKPKRSRVIVKEEEKGGRRSIAARPYREKNNNGRGKKFMETPITLSPKKKVTIKKPPAGMPTPSEGTATEDARDRRGETARYVDVTEKRSPESKPHNG